MYPLDLRPQTQYRRFNDWKGKTKSIQIYAVAHELNVYKNHNLLSFFAVAYLPAEQKNTG